MNGEEVTKRFEEWYKGLKLYRDHFPAKGTISGALVVLERLKEDFNLDIDAHTAKGGSQVSGASGESVKRLLARFGEQRPFVSEGGRTNRGLRGDIKGMLQAIDASGLAGASAGKRALLLEKLQQFLVERVKEFHNRQRLKFPYDPSKSMRQSVRDLLIAAKETGKDGPVAQYLVGAKLQLRFPEEVIENKSYSTADVQLSRVGDFLVGTTAFHVTVSPMPAVYEKCRKNVRDGLRAYLLVPDKFLEGARQNAELASAGKISVESIESFVGQNVEELSTFSSELLPKQIFQLLQVYNQRVDDVEIDKSMLIETPPQLQKFSAES
jgi:hypothetical protein